MPELIVKGPSYTAFKRMKNANFTLPAPETTTIISGSVQHSLGPPYPLVWTASGVNRQSSAMPAGDIHIDAEDDRWASSRPESLVHDFSCPDISTKFYNFSRVFSQVPPQIMVFKFAELETSIGWHGKWLFKLYIAWQTKGRPPRLSAKIWRLHSGWLSTCAYDQKRGRYQCVAER